MSGHAVKTESAVLSPPWMKKKREELQQRTCLNKMLSCTIMKRKAKGALTDVLLEIDPETCVSCLTKASESQCFARAGGSQRHSIVWSDGFVFAFHGTLGKDLEELGSKVDPCDIFVTSKLVNEKQFTALSCE